MFDYIFTIGCFDKFHKGHLKLLEIMKEKSKKIIIGLHDDNSVNKLKNIDDIDNYDNRKNILEKYAYDVFKIDDVDPTNSIKKYISNHFFQGSNREIIRKDNYDLSENIIEYNERWCFMRADDNINFPSIDYIKKVMPIEYLPYSNEISATKLRDYKNNKVGLMNFLLQNVVNILEENNIPYYLDCGTLLGCIRENGFMEKDTDVDVTIHLSHWDDLKSIDFKKYNLIVKRIYSNFLKKDHSNMISVKTKYSELYCDIYANPAFPKLDTTILNGKYYYIPLNSDLYLTQLYGNWKVPSKKHASTKYHRGNGLVNSEYSKYWDEKYNIFKCNR